MRAQMDFLYERHTVIIRKNILISKRCWQKLLEQSTVHKSGRTKTQMYRLVKKT